MKRASDSPSLGQPNAGPSCLRESLHNLGLERASIGKQSVLIHQFKHYVTLIILLPHKRSSYSRLRVTIKCKCSAYSKLAI